MKQHFTLTVSMMLAASSFFFSGPVCGQETGYRNFGSKVDSEAIPAEHPEAAPDIELWLPPELFAEEVKETLFPAVSMSSVMKYDRENAPRRIFILPNNTLALWRITISNGSAGNWGPPPANFLDARTLSFPVP